MLAATLSVAACSTGDGAGTTGSPANSSAATGDGAMAAESTTSTVDPTLTIAVAGDVHFTGRTAAHLDAPDDLISALQPLTKADLAVVNLESAITERGTPEPKQFHFRTPESALTVLDDAGVDVVTLANNHGVDYGRVGLQDTLAAQASSPIPIVGIGSDASAAYAPAMVTVKGQRVAVIGATQVGDRTVQAWSAGDGEPGVASALQAERLAQEVRQARESADIVVVYLHWGVERHSCPSERQRDLTPELVEAGADVIVGTHAHQLQGAGWYVQDGTDAYVSYGLGNFVWWRSNGVPAVTTGVLTLTLDGRRTTQATWTPMRIDDTGIPRVLTGDEAAEDVADWNDARECTGLAADPPSPSGGVDASPGPNSTTGEASAAEAGSSPASRSTAQPAD